MLDRAGGVYGGAGGISLAKGSPNPAPGEGRLPPENSAEFSGAVFPLPALTHEFLIHA